MGAFRNVAVCALALLSALLVGASPAMAAGDDEPQAVVYQVTYDTLLTDLDGSNEPFGAPRTSNIELSCAEDQCTLVTAWGGAPATSDQVLAAQGGAPFAVPGDLSVSGPGGGTLCGGSTDFFLAWRADIQITAEGVTGTSVGDPFTEQCPEGELESKGFTSTITASTLVTGECWFTDAGCVVVAEPDPTVEPTPIAAPDAPLDPVAAVTGSQLATGDASAPSVLSTLATPAEAGTAPSQLLVAVLLTVILVLLVAFPTALLNSAVEAGSDRFSEWWSNRRPTAVGVEQSRAAGPEERPAGAAGSRWSSSWWWAAVGVVAASVLSAFIDPQFGLNAGSARVILSVLVSFAIDVVLGWGLLILLVKRFVPGATHSYVFRPLTLLVVVVAVVFTRVTGFEPGIVFGLVAGVAFGAIVGRAGQARAALVTLGYAFVVAVIAWILYGLVAAASGDSFWSTFVAETLSSVAIGGMAALPIALFPVRGLAGHAIWDWNRWAWAGCYAVGLFAFFVVLMPMPFSWAEVSLNLTTWVGIYLAYAVVAVVAWLALSRPWRRPDPA